MNTHPPSQPAQLDGFPLSVPLILVTWGYKPQQDMQSSLVLRWLRKDKWLCSWTPGAARFICVNHRC